MSIGSITPHRTGTEFVDGNGVLHLTPTIREEYVESWGESYPYFTQGFTHISAVRNYTQRPIYIKRSAGVTILVPPVMPGFRDANPRVEFIEQEVDCTGNQNTTAKRTARENKITYRWTVTEKQLERNPIYIPDLCVVAYFPEFDGSAPHPILDRSYDAFLNQLMERLVCHAGSPISIYMNDPTGILSWVYVEINGHLIAVRVANEATLPADFIFKMYQDPDNTVSQKFTDINYVTKLRDGEVINVNGFLIAARRDRLESYIKHRNEGSKAKVYMTQEEVDKVISAHVAPLQEELAEAKRREAALKAEFELYKRKVTTEKEEGELAVRSGRVGLTNDLELERLRVERVKAESAGRSAEMSFWTSTAKTVAAGVAVGAALLAAFFKWKS